MGENSAIAWTHHTFNPWMGCVRVSPGCERCYAERLVTTRMRLPVWGPPSTTSRHRTSPSTWRLPRAWNRRALATGVRARVFCASLADVFEDHPMVVPWRAELFRLIEDTPGLDWLLLTKRPEHLMMMLPASWLTHPRSHVWLGTTAEDQARAVARIPVLLAVPAVVRFVSVEPMLGSVDLFGVDDDGNAGPGLLARGVCHRTDYGTGTEWDVEHWPGLDWVIVGGESGPDARPCDVAWIRSVVAQCATADVACFVKQLGARPTDTRGDPVLDWQRKLRDPKGGDPTEWPANLRVQAFPGAS
jgi:protein gp37